MFFINWHVVNFFGKSFCFLNISKSISLLGKDFDIFIHFSFLFIFRKNWISVFLLFLILDFLLELFSFIIIGNWNWFTFILSFSFNFISSWKRFLFFFSCSFITTFGSFLSSGYSFFLFSSWISGSSFSFSIWCWCFSSGSSWSGSSSWFSSSWSSIGSWSFESLNETNSNILMLIM